MMSAADILEFARDGVLTFLKISMPLMVLSLVIGLVISLLQALTQLQEQTLIYIPKIVAVFGALLLVLPFMGDALGAYMLRVAARIAAGG